MANGYLSEMPLRTIFDAWGHLSFLPFFSSPAQRDPLSVSIGFWVSLLPDLLMRLLLPLTAGVLPFHFLMLPSCPSPVLHHLDSGFPWPLRSPLVRQKRDSLKGLWALEGPFRPGCQGVDSREIPLVRPQGSVLSHKAQEAMIGAGTLLGARPGSQRKGLGSPFLGPGSPKPGYPRPSRCSQPLGAPQSWGSSPAWPHILRTEYVEGDGSCLRSGSRVPVWPWPPLSGSLDWMAGATVILAE